MMAEIVRGACRSASRGRTGGGGAPVRRGDPAAGRGQARRVAPPPRRRTQERSSVTSSSHLRKGADRLPGRPGGAPTGRVRPVPGGPAGVPAGSIFYACGLRVRRRGTRGATFARAPRAEAGRSGRAVTQKHRQSTLRSTSGGCLHVTRREDCGRVPSKPRCRAVRIMPIVGGMGRDCVYSHLVSDDRDGGIAARPQAGRVPREGCAGGIAEGMGDVGLARHTSGLAVRPGPAVRPPRRAPHVLKAVGRPPGGADTG